MAVAELCRKHAISAATYYSWKSKYAELALDAAAMKEVIARKW